MTTKVPMQLIPVISFEPSSFQTQQRELPHGSGDEYPFEWYHYWKNSLADSGITGIEPYYPGSWLVEINKLITSILEILLVKQHQIDQDWLKTDAENVSSLYGGYIFSYETAHILPECCGSLMDIAHWEMASQWLDTTTETMLWIGHPYLMVKAIDEQFLQISDEYGRKCQINRHELKLAIAETRQQLANFQEILLPAVSTSYPQLSSAAALKVVKGLIYGYLASP
jgi:hypothetical protein